MKKLSSQFESENQIWTFSKYNSIKETKLFKVTCKPNFSNKHSKSDTYIMLNENGE